MTTTAKKVLALPIFGALLGLLWLAGTTTDVLVHRVEHAFSGPTAYVFIAIIAFAAMSAFSEYFSRIIPFEAFVLAIPLGIAGSTLLSPLTESTAALALVVNLSAAIILLQGGLEIKFQNFRKLFLVITMLSFVGLFTTAILFTGTVLLVAKILGVAMLPHVALLLGAILASTDPAALVPLFKKWNWIDETARDVIIAESAGTDVTGTILTLTLLAIVGTAGAAESFDVWSDGYAQILSLEVMGKIGSEMLIGALVGYAGYIGLLALEKYQQRQGYDHGVDALLMKTIGLASFFLAYALHGSGFLAVFVTGLLFNVTGHMKATEHKVGDYIDALFKPAVFVTLGAIVDVGLLVQYAPIGILAGLAFMFINRPIAVALSLLPFRAYSMLVKATGKAQDKTSDVSNRDMLFIASVRETGAIPAVLLLAVKATGMPGADMLVSIGTCVILTTLIIGPLYKLALARRLKIVA